MNYLRIPKRKLKDIVLSLDIKGSHYLRLLAESILATIWSYRDQEDGMHYSNEQLAELFYFSERSVKNIMKAIKEAGLVETKRRYNSSNIVKPSQKFYTMMKEKGTGCPSGKAQGASYTLSKEREIETTKKDLSFETDPSFEKKRLDYRKMGYNDETINRYYIVFKGLQETK